MMSREGKFLIYCVETYKVAKNLTGKQVAELFTRYRVWEYVYSCFEEAGGQCNVYNGALCALAAHL